uniref:Uncharacterized protein n=1 Tax=Anguilla anguilla TaxID=7936 RepID=A0A0E9SKV3_ANGAN
MFNLTTAMCYSILLSSLNFWVDFNSCFWEIMQAIKNLNSSIVCRIHRYMEDGQCLPAWFFCPLA